MGISRCPAPAELMQKIPPGIALLIHPWIGLTGEVTLPKWQGSRNQKTSTTFTSIPSHCSLDCRSKSPRLGVPFPVVSGWPASALCVWLDQKTNLTDLMERCGCGKCPLKQGHHKTSGHAREKGGGFYSEAILVTGMDERIPFDSNKATGWISKLVWSSPLLSTLKKKMLPKNGSPIEGKSSSTNRADCW